MKPYYLLSLLACAAISCSAGSTSEKNVGVDDSTAIEQSDAEDLSLAVNQTSEAAADDNANPSVFFITENGFGPLKIDGKVKDVKANPVDGLYDNVATDRSFNEMLEMDVITGTLSLKGKNVGTFYADGDGVIYCIQFEAPFVKLKVNDKVFSIGSSFKDLTRQRGVTIDDYGSAVFNGVTSYDSDDKIISFNIGSPF